jgi:hypothetical protein
VVTVVELGVALLVFAICAFWIVRHFHGLAEAARDSEDAAQASPPGYLAEPYNVRPAVTPVPKTATIQSAGVQSNSDSTKPKVAEAMVKLDLSPPRPLAAAASAVRAVPASEPSLPLVPVPLPLSAAKYVGARVAAEAAPGALSVAAAVTAPANAATVSAGLDQSSEISPRRQRAAILPPSTAVALPAVALSSVQPEISAMIAPALQPSLDSVALQTQAAQSAADEIAVSTPNSTASAAAPYLISTSQRGARIIGADDDGYDDGLGGFWDMPAPRPKSRSIWSKSLRHAGSEGDLEMMTFLFGQQSVKAERLPIRAEPRLIGQSELRGRRIRATPTPVETRSPPALDVIAFAAPAAAPELLPSTLADDTPQFAVVPTLPTANLVTIPTRSRIKRATKLVGKPRLEPDLKSKPTVATKVLGADPAPLKSLLPQTRKERRTRAVAAPVRKLYLAGQETLPDTSAPSA